LVIRIFQIKLNNKDLSGKILSSKEKDERIRIGKVRLHDDAKKKEEQKRKHLEITSTQELCMLQRKHLLMMHKRECELLLNVRNIVFFPLVYLNLTNKL
jgi:hypothetical protein